MSSMAIRIWIAFNFLTVFLQSFLQYFLECFITTALRKGNGCLHIQYFCHHSGFWWRISRHLQRPQLFFRYSAISLTLLHFPQPAPAPIRLPLHFSEMFYCRVNLCSYLLPSRLKDLQRQPICHTYTKHTHALVMSCDISIGLGRLKVAGSQTQCTKLKITKQNCGKLWKFVAADIRTLLHSGCCSTTTSAPFRTIVACGKLPTLPPPTHTWGVAVAISWPVGTARS